LQKCYEERRAAQSAWGEDVARKYVQAVNLLKAVDHPSHLKTYPQFDYESLTGNREGEHSLKLGYRERLIFTVRKGGDALIARIEEVSTTHYGH